MQPEPPHPPADEEALRSSLHRWAVTHLGAAAVAAIEPMPGNSGLSYFFDAVDDAGHVIAALVIRLAPPGVARRGNTDVLRQAPLLEALHRLSRVPVAELVWSSDDESWFGTDAIIQRRVQARPLHMVRADLSAAATDETRPYLSKATECLAELHRFRWEQSLTSWGDPESMPDELQRWSRLIAKSAEPEWSVQADQLLGALLQTDPGEHHIGLFHGDFQPNNLLFDDTGDLAAVVDWEIAGLGATGVDVGWLSMMTDPDCWAEPYRSRMRVRWAPEEIRITYSNAAALDMAADLFRWYKAAACFEFGVIAAFNVRLHRTGRRTDPFYDLIATSVSKLFSSGGRLLKEA